MLLRTFSKVYGLCGLRVGYALCGSEEFRTAVDQVRQPFFCNAAAQAAAVEALNHQDEVARRVERNLAERIGLEDGPARAGHRARRRRRRTSSGSTSGRTARSRRSCAGSPSAACSCAPGTPLGREGALRVTVGTQAENERFLEALARAALMELAQRPPTPALAPHIRSLAGWLERSDGPVRRRELPGARIVLVVSLGPTLDVDGRTFSSFVAGLHDTPALTEHAGLGHGVQAYLTPLGARRLLGVPMGELTGRVVELEDLIGVREAAELAERLYEAPARGRRGCGCWSARSPSAWRPRAAAGARARARVEPARATRAAACPRRRSPPRSAGAVATSPRRCASRPACRRRRSRACCASSAPPRACAAAPRCADLALDCGFYDQAHLNRDFRAFAGMTPTQYRRSHPSKTRRRARPRLAT